MYVLSLCAYKLYSLCFDNLSFCEGGKLVLPIKSVVGVKFLKMFCAVYVVSKYRQRSAGTRNERAESRQRGIHGPEGGQKEGAGFMGVGNLLVVESVWTVLLLLHSPQQPIQTEHCFCTSLQEENVLMVSLSISPATTLLWLAFPAFLLPASSKSQTNLRSTGPLSFGESLLPLELCPVNSCPVRAVAGLCEISNS